MKPNETIQKACQVLRRKVRYKNASFSLSNEVGMWNPEDTEAIRKATKLYTESWVVPILDYIETGDMIGLRRFIHGDKGDAIHET